MATVVRAKRRTGPPRDFALKFPHPEVLQDPHALEAFHLESQLGQSLRHPSLGETYGIEVVEGREALVLELIRGVSLHTVHERLLRPSADERDFFVISSLVGSVARGLQALHVHRAPDGTALRAVHRDVTPKNIIVTHEGIPKVVDFGIAFSAVRNFRTATGMIKGKVSYMAPEYLRGLAWDHRVDIWSLGVVLWELVTGRRLFSSSSPTLTIQAILSAPIPSPRQLRPEIPEELARIVQRTLARDPEERTPTAISLSAELDEFLDTYDVHGHAGATARWLDDITAPAASSTFERNVLRTETSAMPHTAIISSKRSR